MTHSPDLAFMEAALAQADLAQARGEVPVGAVVVKEGRVISAAHNLRETSQDFTAHAELVAMQRASEILGSWRLVDCTVYVTLEPCPMCAGAMVNARIARCVFGAYDPKGGFLGTLGDLSRHPGLNHRFEVAGGVMEDAAAERLKRFFRALRRR